MIQGSWLYCKVKFHFPGVGTPDCLFSSSSLPYTCTTLQELEDIRKSKLKVFKSVEVDESNILQWKGLIVPVSQDDTCACSLPPSFPTALPPSFLPYRYLPPTPPLLTTPPLLPSFPTPSFPPALSLLLSFLPYCSVPPSFLPCCSLPPTPPLLSFLPLSLLPSLPLFLLPSPLPPLPLSPLRTPHHTTKEHSKLKSISLQSTPSNLLRYILYCVPFHSSKSYSSHSCALSYTMPHPVCSPRLHLRRGYTILTLTRRGRCVCLSSVQKTGSLPLRLIKVMTVCTRSY